MLKWFSVLSCCFVLVASAQQASAPMFESSSKPSLKSSTQLEKAYQQVLYEYYQGNFSLALTKMAILEQQFPDGLSRIPDFLRAQKVEPELLKGGMSLAYGLDNQAADIFQRLLKNNTAADVTAYSWLLLGKTYYQKRQFSNAAYALQQISQPQAKDFFTPAIRDNWLYMQSQLHGFLLEKEIVKGLEKESAQGSDDTDIKWLEQLSDDSIYRDYVEYNQALALLQKGQREQGISRLSALANRNNSFVSRWMDWADPIFSANDQQDIEAERIAVRDRANLTLGYTLLQNDEPHQAFKVFAHIRTNGLDAQAALLGYGWAAAKKDELQTALAIWQRLMQMPQNSEYTLEAYLASAYAYEKAFAPSQSLHVLKRGIQRFEMALVELEHASQQVKQRQFILGLLANTQPQQIGEDQQGRKIANSIVAALEQPLEGQVQTFSSSQLFDSVTVSSEFEAGLSALAQSVDLLQQLQNWQQRMQQYHLMLDERQAVRRKRAKQILKNRTLDQLAQLQIQRDVLAQVIDSAKQQQDGQVFMSPESQQWLGRVERSNKRLITISELKKQLAQAPLADSYTQRIERVAGRLLWQASEAYATNQWQAQKELNLLDEEIVKAQQRQQQLLIQLAAKPDFAEQRQRISALAQRIDLEIAKNNGLQDALIGQLSDTFKQFIQAHKQKVSHYILQAQLAIVRLNDQALKQHSDALEQDNKALKQGENSTPVLDGKSAAGGDSI